MMHELVRKQWAWDLRSTEAGQCEGALRRDTRRCCLGVLADTCRLRWQDRYNGEETIWSIETPDDNDGQSGSLDSPFLTAMVGLSAPANSAFANLNDADKLPFEQIADFADYGWVPRVPDRRGYNADNTFIGYVGDELEPEGRVVENGIMWWPV